MLPFWVALTISLLLHAGALLAPGWSLPAEEEPLRFDARLSLAPPLAPAAALPVAKKRPSRPLAPARRVKPATAGDARPAIPAEAPRAALPAAAGEETALAAEDATSSVAETAPAAESAAPSAAETAPATESAAPPAPSFVSRWPRSGRILYQVMRGDSGFIIGRTEQRWEWDETHYWLQTVAETTGLVALFRPARVIQTSRGGFDAFGVRPVEFLVEREGRENESVRFSNEDGTITFSRGGSAPFVAGAQDLLSVFFQLAGLPWDATEYSVSVATTRKLAAYQVSVGEEVDPLETPWGSRPARRLVVQGRPGEDVTECWLDEATRLPLKIRHRDRKGEVFEQVILEMTVENPQEMH